MSTLDLTQITKISPNQLIVRIRTEYYSTKRGVAKTRKLETLKRKSSGFDFIEEDTAQVGADGVIETIINFDSVDDGIYEVIMINLCHDYETGMLEDWEYKLVPYEETS